MRIEQTIKVDVPEDPDLAQTVTVAYVFNTTAVAEPVHFHEEIVRTIMPMGAGPDGWLPIELRVAAHFGLADLTTWERVAVIEDEELRQICEQARSKAMWRLARAESWGVDRITIELRPATPEQAAYRTRSPIDLAFEVQNTSEPVQRFLAEERAALDEAQTAGGDTFDFPTWERSYRERLAHLLHGDVKS